MRLLLVEDDIALGEGLRDFLETENHNVIWVKSLSQARSILVQTLRSILNPRPCGKIIPLLS